MGELHGESRVQTCLQQHDLPCLLSWETNHGVSEEFPEPGPSRKQLFHLRPRDNNSVQENRTDATYSRPRYP